MMQMMQTVLRESLSLEMVKEERELLSVGNAGRL